MSGIDRPHETTDPLARKRKALRPRDAATLVVYDNGTHGLRILMGRRGMDQVFLPGHYVFPGGRVDRGDQKVPLASPLAEEQTASLMLAVGSKASLAKASSMALAAVRETFEETGYVIGGPAGSDALTAKCAPAWQRFLATGRAPALNNLVYFARAITPPGRPRRFDTRFFAVAKDAASGPFGNGDGELEDIGWRTIEDARGLKLPTVTRLVLEDFIGLLTTAPDDGKGAGGKASPAATGAGIPFYFQRNGVFQRAVLSRNSMAP